MTTKRRGFRIFVGQCFGSDLKATDEPKKEPEDQTNNLTQGLESIGSTYPTPPQRS